MPARDNTEACAEDLLVQRVRWEHCILAARPLHLDRRASI